MAHSEMRGIRSHAAEVFERAAAMYERVGPPFFTHYGRRLVEFLNVRSGSTVLDVAAGTGAVLLAVADRMGPSGVAIGVDLAAAMVERLSQEFVRRDLTGVGAAVMDAQALAFSDVSFDYVLCAFALHGFPDPDGALEEFRRVLRPEGRLGLTLSSKWWWEGDDRWAWHGELLDSLGAPFHPSRPRFTTPAEVESDLAGHGFEDVSVIEDAFPLVFEDFEEWWRWGWSHGYRRILEWMGEEQLRRYRETCARELESRTTGVIEGRLEVLLASARRA